ncbi:DUF2065 domain-containing protein [Aquibaculum arenosum]|uniref:DUF2065 domain-containing protein n=1 Tax=Aquibaculum arenosum TaxID=3032591 RepID=A0ABT5YMK4_9PROT|nr:DUF2065 domain-containing protein [Fodinicurvata sp. CAU 1616]MDF2096104.1 DUF2065 domain-containing protein [Fodinicurvata sp. CAU 1616]
MTDLLTALALVLVIEGLMLALAPNVPQRVLLLLAQVPHSVLRTGGLAAMALGTFFVWLLRG